MENRPLKPRRNYEELMMRRRDKEARHAETWGGAVKYYDRVGKQNAKFTEWTSPRYYETNNELVASIRKTRDKQELLEKRRDKLKKLFEEEEMTYKIELTMKRADGYAKKGKVQEVPTEVLKEINDCLKLEEEAKRRFKAEEGLYRQWRSNNPVLRECQRRENAKELKMSWLDQQIEKRMAREKEEELTKKMFKEKERYIHEQKAKEEELKKEVELKKGEIKLDLDKQMEEIRRREESSKILRMEEDEALRKSLEVLKLQDKWEEEERKRIERETVLYNLKQHRRKLELKSKEIEEELDNERRFMEEIKKAQLVDRIEDENKKLELKHSMEEFLRLTKELKELEKQRKPHILFTFESEAKGIFDRFDELWKKEQQMRSDLIRDVLREIKAQIDVKVERTKERQKELVREKEEMLTSVVKYKEEMEMLAELEARKKEEFKKDLDEQVKENVRRKKRLENLEKEKACSEFEQIKDEEERLKKEILRIQKGKFCPTYGRRRFFY